MVGFCGTLVCGTLDRLITGRQIFPALQAFENVIDRLDQHRAFTNQLVTASSAGVMDRSWDGIYLAALLCSQPRGNQRSAGNAGFHHEHAEGQAADDSIASREVAGVGFSIQRQFRNYRATLSDDVRCKVTMPLWIKFFDPRPKHPDSGAFYIQRALMSCPVDAHHW